MVVVVSFRVWDLLATASAAAAATITATMAGV